MIVSLTSGIGMGGDASGDILTSIENLQGSHWHDTLAGDPNDNKLDGLDGNDVLLGGGGGDTLLGGAGFDTLYQRGRPTRSTAAPTTISWTEA